MLPFNATQKINCLESLVGIRTQPISGKDFSKTPYFIEDIEGVDIKKLASLAKGTNGNGTDFGMQLINSAAREVMGDLELFLNNGYTLNSIIGDLCSTCSLLPQYLVNSGINIKSNVLSGFQVMQITLLKVLINRTGSFVFIIDDGYSPQSFTADFVAGVISPIQLNYTTSQTSVNIYFQDTTIGLGQILCPNNSSCGCGSGGLAQKPVTISGIVNQLTNSIMYGFLPCVGINCSTDALVCDMIKKVPNIFGLAMLYKVGHKYFLHRTASDRNNDAVAFNEGDQDEVTRNYAALYNTQLHGANNKKGIKHIVNDYLRTKLYDKCITCNSSVHQGYVTG